MRSHPDCPESTGEHRAQLVLADLSGGSTWQLVEQHSRFGNFVACQPRAQECIELFPPQCVTLFESYCGTANLASFVVGDTEYRALDRSR